MSLVGKYVNNQIGATLEIDSANPANGQGSGKFTIAGNTINVEIHYHFQNSGGPRTVYRLWGGSDSGECFYVGAAGNSTDTGASQGIALAGGYSTVARAEDFEGLFTRA